MWVQKYAPKTMDEIVGQEEVKRKLRAWIKTHRGGFLAFGPPGIGKTTMAYALAHDLGLEVIEMNASDFRRKKDIQERLMGAALQASLFGKGKLLIIDEVDGMSGRKDFGGSSAINELITKSNFPIYLTCNDNWANAVRNIKKNVMEVKFTPPKTSDVLKILERIIKKEKVNVARSVLLQIATSKDIRSAITDLEAIVIGRNNVDEKSLDSLGERNRNKTIFDALREIFKSTNVSQARKAVNNLEGDVDDLLLWIDENIPREYQGEALVKAYDALSRADVFRGRIYRRQDWSLLKHVINLSTAGVALAKKKTNFNFVGYMPPIFLMMMGRTRGTRATRNSLLTKIGKITHTSRRASMGYLQVLKVMQKKKSLPFELEDKEISFLKKV